MPERKMIAIQPTGIGSEDFIKDSDKLSKMFNDGWILDPLFNSKPIRLENAVIYHLIKYSPEEKTEFEASEAKVESVKSVGYEQVDELIKQGYQPRDYYAKIVIMIKMEEKTE